MDTDQNLNDCTRVLVSNLHEEVNASYLSQCFSNNVDPPRCKTELLPDPTKAIVDLGSFAKTQEAVCKMNGEEAYGKRMSVSLYLESFVPSSEKKVQLSQFPTYWRYSNFYDLLQIQNLGTIVGIELLHDPDDENRVQQAFVTFLTEAQARNAVEVINTNQEKYFSIRARPNKIDNNSNAGSTTPRSRSTTRPRRVSFSTRDIMVEIDTTRPPSARASKHRDSNEDDRDVSEVDSFASSEAAKPALDLSPFSTEKEKKQAVYEFLLAKYDDKIKPRKKFVKILEVLRDCLDPQHMLDNCVKEERFELYKLMVEEALEQGHTQVTQVSTDALEAAEEMNLHFMNTKEEKLQAIRDILRLECLGKYSRDSWERILDTIMQSYPTHSLLEACVNEKLLRTMALHAKMAIEMNSKTINFSLSEAAVDILLQIDMDKLDTSEWKQALKKYLVQWVQNRYGHEHLESIWCKSFLSLIHTDDLYELIGRCTHENVLRQSVFLVKVADGTHSDIAKFSFPEQVSSLILQLELDKLDPPDGWHQALETFLFDFHRERYGDKKTQLLLRKMNINLAFLGDVYGLLELCANEEEFRLIAFYTLHKNEPYIFLCLPPFTDAAKKLALQLELDKHESKKENLQALRDHLATLYEKRYGKEQFSKILDMILEKLSLHVQDESGLFHSLSRNVVFGLLEICADSNRFRLLAFHAKVAMANNSSFYVPPLSDAIEKFILDGDMDKMDTVVEWIWYMGSVWAAMYMERYGTMKINALTQILLSSSLALKNVYRLLELSTNEDEFRIMAFYAPSASEAGIDFFKPVFSHVARRLILELNLDGLGSVTEFQEVCLEELRRYVMRTYQKKYGVERLKAIVDGLQLSIHSHTDLYTFIELCASDADCFHVYALLSESVGNGYYFQQKSFPSGMVSLIRQLELGKLDNLIQVEQSLREHLHRSHTGRYDNSYLQQLINATMQCDDPNFHDWYGFLSMWADEAKFQIYAKIVSLFPQDNDLREIYQPISDSVLSVVHALNLMHFQTLEEWKSKLFNFLQFIHQDHYEKERLERVIEKMGKDFVSIGNLYELLKCCDRYHFSIFVVLVENAIEENMKFDFPFIPENYVEKLRRKYPNELPSVESILAVLNEPIELFRVLR